MAEGQAQNVKSAQAQQQVPNYEPTISSAEFIEPVPVPADPKLGRITDSSRQVQSRHGWDITLKPGLLVCRLKEHWLEVPLANVKWIRRG